MHLIIEEDHCRPLVNVRLFPSFTSHVVLLHTHTRTESLTACFEHAHMTDGHKSRPIQCSQDRQADVAYLCCMHPLPCAFGAQPAHGWRRWGGRRIRQGNSAVQLSIVSARQTRSSGRRINTFDGSFATDLIMIVIYSNVMFEKLARRHHFRHSFWWVS